ncbi:MAG: carbohydrate-binding domain-containing protein [Lachnospiraceae bacterium]|nr:carbohydrate-binding domain-containing protein [Lachnospiraceae bacterium]
MAKIIGVVLLLGVIAGGVLFCVLFGDQIGSGNISGDSQSTVAEADSADTAGNAASSEADGTVEARADISTLTPDEDNQTQIVFSGNTITVDGSGASASDSVVTISDGGTYSVSGSMENGQIYVGAGGSDEVIIILNGLTLSHEEESVIYVENAGQTQLILAEGTVNTLQSGTAVEISALEEGADDDASGGAVYARDDLSISGEGILVSYGYINNGIQTTNNLLIDSGTYQVTALGNGIKGKDSVTITGGLFTITAGGDGVKSNDTSGDNYGVVTISGGTFVMEVYGDGVQAETMLTISGGSFDIVTGGGSSEATYSSSENWRVYGSNWDMSDETDSSAKALKGGTKVTVSGGSFTIDSYDDAVHSNGSVVITGGTFEIASGDDGIHGDASLEISGGTINISDCYEGLEANQISISGGDITLTAYDDGLNANGGSTASGFGMGGQNSSASSTSDDFPTLRITDGSIVVNAGGDGLDSNGDIIIEGGLVIVNGPTDSQNGAIDSGSEYGGTCTISGGTLLALGSSGMAEGFASSSEQCSFMVTMTASFSAGDGLTVTDSGGNVIYQYTITKSGSSVVFSSPDLTLGATYTLTVGSQSVEVTLNSVSTTTRGGSQTTTTPGGQTTTTPDQSGNQTTTPDQSGDQTTTPDQSGQQDSSTQITPGQGNMGGGQGGGMGGRGGR